MLRLYLQHLFTLAHALERNKKARGEVTGYKPLLIATMGEYCEGCGIPRHKQESCNLKDHPDLG